MNVTHEYKPTPKGGEASTTDTVTYNYKIVNNGVLSLYGLALRDSVLQAHGAIITCKNADGTTWVGSEAGVADNLAPNADKGLPPLGWLVCTGSDKVTQKEVYCSAVFANFRHFTCPRVREKNVVLLVLKPSKTHSPRPTQPTKNQRKISV